MMLGNLRLRQTQSSTQEHFAHLEHAVLAELAALEVEHVLDARRRQLEAGLPHELGGLAVEPAK